MLRRGVRALPGGRVRVQLEEPERQLLRSLATQLRPLVRGDSDDLELLSRLYPAASEDPDTDAAYRELVGDSLVEGRLDSLDTFTRTLTAAEARGDAWRVELEPDEAAAWLSVVNDARLTLALVVGVDSEGDWEAGPDATDPSSVALWWLGWLEEELLAALTASL